MASSRLATLSSGRSRDARRVIHPPTIRHGPVSGARNRADGGSLRVPDDLALVGFDETESFDFFYSPLTYIKQPLQAMGEIAVNALLEDIKTTRQTKQVVLDSELVIRKSTVRG